MYVTWTKKKKEKILNTHVLHTQSEQYMYSAHSLFNAHTPHSVWTTHTPLTIILINVNQACKNLNKKIQMLLKPFCMKISK